MPEGVECAEVVHLGPLRPRGIMIQGILPVLGWVSGGGRNPEEVGGQRGSEAANFNFNNGNRNWNHQSNSNNNRALPVRSGKWTLLFFHLRTFTGPI